MKKLHFLLICLFVIVHTNASARTSAISSDAQTQQAVGSSTVDSTTLTTADFSAQTAPVPSMIQHKPVAHARLSKIKRGVVKEIKATSAFVQQQAAKAETSDGRLIALV
ncbi:MAG TPA: hypothetical protein VKJ65_00240, partial [Phycisphaerae bacterium]|nr:hypothetical protein [Phycisphaerae bacterium]